MLDRLRRPSRFPNYSSPMIYRTRRHQAPASPDRAPHLLHPRHRRYRVHRSRELPAPFMRVLAQHGTWTIELELTRLPELPRLHRTRLRCRLGLPR